MTVVTGKTLRLRAAAGGSGNGNYWAIDDQLGTANNATTIASFGTTTSAQTMLLKPGASNSTTATIPASPSSTPSGFGWWVIPSPAQNPGSYRDMNDASYWTRTIPAGVWSLAASLVNTNSLSSTALTLTAIFYKMTSTTAGSEIGRLTLSASPTNQAQGTATGSTASIAAQTLTYGQTIAVECYLTGTGAALIGNSGELVLESTTNSGQPTLTLPGNMTAAVVEPAAGAAARTVASGAKGISAKKSGGAAMGAVSSASKAVSVGKSGGSAANAVAAAPKSTSVQKSGGSAAGAAASASKVVRLVKSGGAAVVAAASASKVVTVVKPTSGAAASSVAGGSKAVSVSKSGGSPVGTTAGAHYQLVTYTIAGYTRDNNTNATLGACTVKLFNSSDVLQQTSTSDATTGYYFFTVPGSFVGWVSATRSGSTPIEGRTGDGLTPISAVVQSG